MGWTDKYKCEHDYERTGEVMVSWDYTLFKTEVKCTKCGHTTQIDMDYIDKFLAARKPKDTTKPEVVVETKPVEKDEPDVFKEIYSDNFPTIPDSAISHIDGDSYVDTIYATTIVERAIMGNSSLVSSPDYRSTYVSLYDLSEILDFINTL